MNKNIIAAVLFAITFIIAWLAFDKDEVVRTITKTKIEYVKQSSALENTKPVSIEIRTIKVPVVRDSIVRDTVYLDKKVKLYTYVDSLPNGIITSKITADNIYKRDIKLETTKEIVTTETTNTIVRSVIFLDLGVNKHVVGGVKDINIGVNYTRKDKWRLGITGGYDLAVKDPFIGVKIGIPLN